MDITDTYFLKEFGQRLRNARESLSGLERKKISRKELSRRLHPGYDDPSLSEESAYDIEERIIRDEQNIKNWESGTTRLSLCRIPSLCRILDCDAGYLFGEYKERHHECQAIVDQLGFSSQTAQRFYDLLNHPPIVPLSDPNIASINPRDVLSCFLSQRGLLRFIQYCSMCAQILSSMNVDPTERALEAFDGEYDAIASAVRDQTNGGYCITPVEVAAEQYRNLAKGFVDDLVDALVEKYRSDAAAEKRQKENEGDE